MRIEYKSNERKRAGRMEKGNYDVLAFGKYNTDTNIFLFADDDLIIRNIDPSVINVIDDNLSEYSRMDHLNFGNEFYVSNSFLPFLFPFDDYYGQLTYTDIWTLSKLAPFFLKNNYYIPNKYMDTVLNEDYKMNLIEGFLFSSTHYINIRNTTDYKESLRLTVSNTMDGHVEDQFKKEDWKVEILNPIDYQKYVFDFLKNALFLRKPGDEESKAMVNHLFKLFDSIFMSNISEMYFIHYFYEDGFVVRYQDKFYGISKGWSS